MGQHDKGGSVVMLEPAFDRTPRHGSHASSIVDFDAEGQPRVDVDGVAVSARATVEVSREDLGREAMVTFLEGDPTRPVITGLFVAPKAPPRRRHMKIKAQELDFEASSKITFECGKSSITLHRDGKIVLRGEHLLSRASGVNRIRGGNIELN
jgi:hypothetical protein